MSNLSQLRQTLGDSLFSAGEHIVADGCVTNSRELQGGAVVTGVVKNCPSDANGKTTGAPGTYRVYIQLSGNKVDGECSCGVNGNCAHVAAVLIANASATAATTQPAQAAGGIRREEPSTAAAAGRQQLFYKLELQPQKPGGMEQACHLNLSIWVGRLPFAPRSANAIDLPRYVSEQDQAILKPLLSQRAEGPWPLGGDAGAILLHQIAETGRFYADTQLSPLRPGDAQNATVEWEMLPSGEQRLLCNPHALSIGLDPDPPVYIDLDKNCWGTINFSCDLAQLRELAARPPVQPEEVTLLNRQFAECNFLPRLKELQTRRVAASGLNAKLVLTKKDDTAFASLHFLYNGEAGSGLSFHSEQSTVRYVNGDTLYLVERDHLLEEKLLAELNAAIASASESAKATAATSRLPGAAFTFALRDSQAWLHFMLQSVPALKRGGWQVDIDAQFPYQLASGEKWYGQLHTASKSTRTREVEDWFNLEFGIMVDGQPINLLPILVEQLRQLSSQASRRVGDRMLITLADGRYLPIPMERIDNILQALVELFDTDCLDEENHLTLPRAQFSRLAQLTAGITDETAAEANNQLLWSGEEELLALAEKFKRFTGIQPLQPPPNFLAQLRPYQREGLGWLQFLREYGLGGILADDMGLGKTVQTLAHLAIEKQCLRLQKPSLIVAPTSLIGNWEQEARRFAPELEILVLHGSDRKNRFSRVPEADLVITSYPLLNFDTEQLLAHEFYLVILDEAQTIKNPRAKVSRVARELNAEHRLCLTGTPMENHLGELWALFDFLQPGFLGSERQFQRLYRTPIEKEGNDARSEGLSKRIAPFILRRTKGAVATELPPKTEILQRVVLEEDQRDFYDGIRLAMHKQIREVIEQQGFARSRIAVLDALLKLRQACCDPRLVKLETEQEAIPSAKFELLMSMLPELVEEGRRVLLFSQFTSMLDLIEEALREQGLAYLKLTGQTRDRARLVEQFQAGEVPLFLISLKAGGTGLNLTAADTVIHYDPWWNPAAENQATDRAYRIGQDKPVFVYKLITEGTVEEKILQLQERKRELASGVYSGKNDSPASLTAEDLEALFH